MAPSVYKKPPRKSTKWGNINGDNSFYQEDWSSPARSRKSNVFPEYLIRTGSMKSKDIKDDYGVKDRDYVTMPGSHYASYLLQAGCFLWTGRAYYKDSYIVQRKEEKKKTKKTIESETEEAKDIKEQIENNSCGRPLLPEKTLRNKKYSGEDMKENTLLVNKSEDNSSKREFKSTATLNDDIKINSHKSREKAKTKSVQKNISGLMDMFKNVDLDDNYSNIETETKMQTVDKTNNPKYDKEAESDNETHDTSLTDEDSYLFMMENKGNLCNLNVDVDSQRIKNTEACNNVSDRFRDAALYENFGTFLQKDSLPRLERIDKEVNKKTHGELLKRMRDKISDLVEKQFEVDNKIVMNDITGKDIASKLSYFASDREKEKFILHVEEFDSVTCLILGLSRRLAKTEQDIGQENKKKVAEERKREKLASQLTEAWIIKENINKRSIKVLRSIERYLGVEEMEQFKLFIRKKEKLLSENKELGDKMRLCKKQLSELELGERGWTGK